MLGGEQQEQEEEEPSEKEEDEEEEVEVLGEEKDSDESSLSLAGEMLSKVPTSIISSGGLRNHLTHLNLSSNLLIKLPTAIGNLLRLRVLTLTWNKLVSLPAEIGKLCHLRELHLGFNALESLPASIGELTLLELLEANDNLISELPSLHSCRKLKSLKLQFNNIRSVHPSLGDCIALEECTLLGNPLVSPPLAVAMDGAEAIRKYVQTERHAEQHRRHLARPRPERRRQPHQHQQQPCLQEQLTAETPHADETHHPRSMESQALRSTARTNLPTIGRNEVLVSSSQTQTQSTTATTTTTTTPPRIPFTRRPEQPPNHSPSRQMPAMSSSPSPPRLPMHIRHQDAIYTRTRQSNTDAHMPAPSTSTTFVASRSLDAHFSLLPRAALRPLPTGGVSGSGFGVGTQSVASGRSQPMTQQAPSSVPYSRRISPSRPSRHRTIGIDSTTTSFAGLRPGLGFGRAARGGVNDDASSIASPPSLTASIGMDQDALTLEDANCVRELLRRNRNPRLLASLEPLFDTIGMPSSETGHVLASLADPSHERQQLPTAEPESDVEDDGDDDVFGDEDVPKAFLCPITLCLMREPVVAQDGHTYERRAVSRWFQSENRSPMTGQPVASFTLTPNFALKSMIDDFRIQRKRRV